FNDLCGEKLFDPFDRAPGCAAIRLRRGSGRRFTVQRVDGGLQVYETPEEHASDVETVRAAALARTEVDRRSTTLADFDRERPNKPRWWQLWKWPGYLAQRGKFRKRSEQRLLTAAGVSEAQRQFEAAERAANEVIARTTPARDLYLSQLRAVASGGAAGVGVEYVEVEVEVIEGMLPEGVEVLELTGASRASAEVDAVVIIQKDGVYAPGLMGSRPRLGDLTEVIAGLPMMLAEARSLAIGRRYRDKISVAVTSLDQAIQRKEDNFRERISALEAMRVTDPAGFIEVQLARVQPQVIGSVNTVLEHASVHLGSELAQVRAEWVEALAKASSGGDLATVVSRIDDAWESTFKRVAEEVRLLAMGGIGGSARDLYVELILPLVGMGLPEQHAKPPRAAPVLAPVSILHCLTASGTKKLDDTGFFAGLFRSFETRKSEVRAKAAERLERLQEVAALELMEAEPKFHGAIRAALVAQLAGAIDIQTRTLDTSLATERTAIAAERDQLAPLIAVRDLVRHDLGRLAAQIARIETEQPALSIATTAAETASLSH
ncbi:MAG: hypothetical protein H0V17_18035, partial [Deltaproteobacteria bacterium]|nr:hypothetical protein [Deltaproteobacteria bacterium]